MQRSGTKGCGEIAKLFPPKAQARPRSGFVLEISLFLSARQIDKASGQEPANLGYLRYFVRSREAEW